MAEGPQVWLRARWLHRDLSGKTPIAVETRRDELVDVAKTLSGRRVQRVFAHGKNLFLEFEGGVFVHNHLRMDGRWRQLPLSIEAPTSALPASTWLAFRFERECVFNIDGQVIASMTREEVDALVATLGPDVMDEPFPREAIVGALASTARPIADALMDQSIVAGIGNTAKSEALFLARIDPRAIGSQLARGTLSALADAIQRITRESVANQGCWVHRVYLRAGEPCPVCATSIASTSQSGRVTFSCPRCQSAGEASTPSASPSASILRASGRFDLGLAVWAYAGFLGSLYPEHAPDTELLRLYSERFSTVEGNSTFYALPTEATLARWALETEPGFRYAPKLSRDITHASSFASGIEFARTFLARVRVLGDRLGPVFAQLPEDCGPDRLDDLCALLASWPRAEHPLLVEVRHPAFFEDVHARELDRRLTELGVGRAILDTRPIYAFDDDARVMSGRRKPKLSLCESATSSFAIVRFVGHPDRARNTPYLERWSETIARWLAEGRDVTFFAHCPVEEQSPWIARDFHAILSQRVPSLPPLAWQASTAPKRQLDLF